MLLCEPYRMSSMFAYGSISLDGNRKLIQTLHTTLDSVCCCANLTACLLCSPTAPFDLAETENRFKHFTRRLTLYVAVRTLPHVFYVRLRLHLTWRKPKIDSNTSHDA